MGSLWQRKGSASFLVGLPSCEEGFKLKLPRDRNLSPSLSYQFDARASKRCPEPGEGMQVSRRAPEEQHNGIPATPSSKSGSSGAQLKFLYANACSIGSKHEELETCTHLQGCDHIGITETW